MKKKYCIGFLWSCLCLSVCRNRHQVSYQYDEQQMARQQDKQQRSVAVKGEAEK